MEAVMTLLVMLMILCSDCLDPEKLEKEVHVCVREDEEAKKSETRQVKRGV